MPVSYTHLRLKLIQLKNPGVFVYLSGGLLMILAVLRLSLIHI